MEKRRGRPPGTKNKKTMLQDAQKVAKESDAKEQTNV